jgi:metallo-beta-lactamase family protein
MKITFIGATHEVTGSCHYVEANGKNFIVDCGLEQGEDVFENQEIPVNAADVDFVLITHAHIDHTGMLPWLYARGFRGPIYATQPTCELCDIMLRDSAHIQTAEVEMRNKKGKRAGKKSVDPLYEMKDALGVIKLFKGFAYDTDIEVADGITIRFTDVGHLLGSASITVTLEENGEKRVVCFSGDIGNDATPLIKNPSYVKHADYVVMESTYGDRLHAKDHGDYVEELARITQETLDRGGNLVIPAFAVGRTQEMLFYFRKIKQNGMVTGHGNFKVYMDSPLAIEATTIFNRNMDMCFDKEALELAKQGVNPLTFPGLRYAITSDESKLINFDDSPKVIISASGMCDAGRIRHHLKYNLWREESTILFVGYQANGTLGRLILDGVKNVKLMGEEIEVLAHIYMLEGFSGHADRDGLERWVEAFDNKPEKVFVVHGEDTVCESFAERLKELHGLDAYAPYSGTSFDLIRGEFINEAYGVRLVDKKGDKKRKISAVFARLIAAGERLMAVINHNEGGTNKDLGKFADQINSLCDKWDR